MTDNASEPYERKPLDHSEEAYRRGVHQAYAMLRHFIEQTQVDPMTALQLFEEEARKWRYSDQEQIQLLDRIWIDVCERWPDRSPNS